MKPQARKLIVDICRIALGGVFIFSGLMKCIDTWGTAQKVGDYLTVFGMDWLLGAKVALAILLSAAELVMGLMLVAGVRKRLVSLAVLVFMVGFTLLTLYIAIWDPLDECGCFGEAVRISNWSSFCKNVVLLGLSIVTWCSNRSGRYFAFTRREIIWTVVFTVFALSLGIVVYRHLPPIDQFPYKKGMSLRTDVLCTVCMDRSVMLVYRDTQTGQEREFSLEDTEWHDAEKWEYVTTRTAYDKIDPDRLDEDFAVYRGEYNAAADIAAYEGRTVLVIAHAGADMSVGCREKLMDYIAEQQQDTRILVITERGDDRFTPRTIELGGMEYPVLTMESKALGYLLRADAGVVTIDNGVITGKKNCRDL